MGESDLGLVIAVFHHGHPKKRKIFISYFLHMNPEILVVGSLNTDMVIRTSRIPAPGETVIGGEFMINPGGKGANQAVAAARCGGRVRMIGKTGSDIFGKQAREGLEAAGIDTRGILVDPVYPSGVAMITVDANGENSIVVAPGANGRLLPLDIIGLAGNIQTAGLILTQMEIPLDSIECLAAIATEHSIPLILNPAPAVSIPSELLHQIDILTPNETEAAILTGIPVTDIASAREAALNLAARGVKTVIITLGNKGALLHHQDINIHIPGYPVKAVDSTAAGDVFNGALAVGVSEGMDMLASVEFACKAASISVTRPGFRALPP
jgi:ribokinase